MWWGSFLHYRRVKTLIRELFFLFLLYWYSNKNWQWNQWCNYRRVNREPENEVFNCMCVNSVFIGYYICSASNIVGTGRSAQSYLTVSGGKPIVSIPNPAYTVTTGNEIVIPCIVSSSPAASSILWRRISNGIYSSIY